ncbi:MAG: sulfite exporter TauE/SafE family protein [Acidimicrobiales bacterium]
MSTDIVMGSAVVGLLVGVTGSGGGALMTPMLILLFSVKPSAAISSDLVAAVLMRPVGSAVHFRRGTVNLRLVGWMSAGTVPAAFAGAYLVHLLGHTKAATTNVETALGAALLLGAGAMVLRYLLDRRDGRERRGGISDVAVRPLLTLAVGMLGGVVVGMTSVGAGSLMIVLLMFIYPTLGANQLVGTDLVQAIPLTGAAALGALAFGHVELPLTISIVVGSLPAVFVGSLLSSRVQDRYLRTAITVVILAAGLKYVGMTTTELAWSILAALVVVVGNWLLRARTWRRASLELGSTSDKRGSTGAGARHPDT